MPKLTLPSGFTFDYTNLLGPEAVREEDVTELLPELANVMEKADSVRASGVLDGHLSKDGEAEPVLFPELPYIEEGHINSPSSMQRLKDLQAHAQKEIDLVINFGIGGSYLGNKVLFDVECGEFWNEKSDKERNHYPRVLFSGNNVDSRRMAEMVAYIKDLATIIGKNFKALLLIISKSGSTIETMSNFMVVKNELDKEGIAYEVVAVTDPQEGCSETLLHQIASNENWPMFSVPDGVGGRFSVFTEVGLVLGALIGFDVENFLAGAAAADKACRNKDVFQNPALLGAALKFLASEKYGRNIEVFMPYAEYMRSTSEWYVQLLSESLGKTRADGKSYYGRTPVVAVGTTDMHAQTQEHQEGKLNKVVQFVRVKKWRAEVTVPAIYNQYPKLAAFSGLNLDEIMSAAMEANAKALEGANRFSAIYELPALNAFHLGELMFMLCWAIFFEGELADVDAFNQPGVEVYKRLLGPNLAKLKEQKNLD